MTTGYGTDKTIFEPELLEPQNKWVVPISDLGNENYTLIKPILILIEEYSDGDIIARFPALEAYGVGETDAIAITDLKSTMLDLYDELTEIPLDMLGTSLQEWVRILKKIIVKY